MCYAISGIQENRFIDMKDHFADNLCNKFLEITFLEYLRDLYQEPKIERYARVYA